MFISNNGNVTNDVKYICHDQWKSDSEKENDLICLAHDFVDMVKQLIVQFSVRIFCKLMHTTVPCNVCKYGQRHSGRPPAQS